LTLSALALSPFSSPGEDSLSPEEVAEDAQGAAPEDHEQAATCVVGSFDFDPDTLNLKSGGKYVTGYLELPEGYLVQEVFVPSVKLNGAVYAETCFGVQIFDTDRDGVNEVMLKFLKADVKAILAPGDCVTVTVSGMMNDGTWFIACDSIAVSSQ